VVGHPKVVGIVGGYCGP